MLNFIEDDLATSLPHLRVKRICAQDHCPEIYIVGEVGNKKDSPQSLLRRDGLLGAHSWDKFIPAWVKTAPADVRLAFIQGLFDTDGCMDDRGHVEYVTVSERLALDVQWVLRSLGFRATMCEKSPTYTYKGEKLQGRLAYRFYVQGANKDRLFRLPRKRDCVMPFNGGDVDPSHRVVSVEKTVIDNARCITIDNPNHLYITDDFIVTHNSWAILLEALRGISNPQFNAVIFRRTYPMIRNAGGLWDASTKLYPLLGAKPRESNLTWFFDSQASVAFRHLKLERDCFGWQGSEIVYIAFDELTHFR